MKSRKVVKHAATAVAVTALVTGCGKKSSSDDATDSTSTAGTDTTTTAGVSPLSSAYPSTLALAIFPQVTSTTALLLADEVDDPNAKKNFKGKIEDQGKRLKGEGDCFNPAQFKPTKARTEVTCYHFDSDMNPAKITTPNGDRQFGTVDGKVSGTDSEACMVAFARAEVEDSVQQVDRALAMVSGMICQAKKDGADTQMPAVGESLNLTKSFDKGDVGLKSSTATITRLADVSGNAVYRSDISTTAPDGKAFVVHLVHSPGAGDTSTGTLSIQRPGDSGMGGKDGGSADKNALLSINYSREVDDAGKKRMRFEVRRAAMAKTIEPFDSAGLVNLGAVAQGSGNSELGAVKYVAFDIDPDTNAGNLSYWMNPGGTYNEAARGFLFNITAGTDGTLSGCGTSGATDSVSVRKSLAEPTDANILKPAKWWHPFATASGNTAANKDTRYNYAAQGQGTSREGAAVTEQCFKQDATSGVYLIDTAKLADQTATARGYNVIATNTSIVQPPTRPKAKLQGDFVPKSN